MANGMAASSPNAARTSTFHPFPRLPIELRLKIFSHVPLPHRMIKIASDNIIPLNLTCFGRYRPLNPRRDADYYLIYHRVKISVTIPAILQVCTEARDTFLGKYPLLLAVATVHRPVRVNFELDTFHFVDREAHISFEHAYYENLRYDRSEWDLVRTSIRQVAYGDDSWEDKLPFPNLTSVVARDWRKHEDQRQRLLLEYESQRLVDQRDRDASLPNLQIHYLLTPDFDRMILSSQPTHQPHVHKPIGRIPRKGGCAMVLCQDQLSFDPAIVYRGRCFRPSYYVEPRRDENPQQDHWPLFLETVALRNLMVDKIGFKPDAFLPEKQMRRRALVRKLIERYSRDTSAQHS